MGAIHQLSEEVIIKIAAGEVVERPGSVIKELLENSLDSGAKNISLFIDKNSLRILDDGKGMSKEDLEICYLRHTTSKINSSDDLFNINSLGFRGEALASITAVSKSKITSKKEEEEAFSITVEGGVASQASKSAFPNEHGTEIEVNDLFYNTPARKKYMKTWATELRVMLDVIQQYALAYKQVSFTCYVEKEIVLKATATEKYEERFFHVFGADTAKHMITINNNENIETLATKRNLETQGISISGIISKPQLFRKTRDQEIIFINGRLVKSRMIYAAIAQAYTGYLNTGESPVVLLDIKVDPKRVDVNVHPTKQEVKFDDEQTIFRAVYHTIQDCLKSNNLTIKITERKEQPVTEYRKPNSQTLSFEPQKPSNQMLLADEGMIEQKPRETTDKENLPIKILAIFNKEFIVAEQYIPGPKLVVIDFHAAAEIVNYEKFSKQFEDGGIATQALIEPITLDISPADVVAIIENKELLENLGFTIEQFGPSTILIRTIPTLFGKTTSYKIINDIIGELRREGSKNAIEKKKESIIIRMSCRASEKAGDEITLIQAQRIVENLFRLKNNSYNCPHGRPTIIEFSKFDLEKMFKRIR
jgi:DNA mismatch repair protein MutL